MSNLTPVVPAIPPTQLSPGPDALTIARHYEGLRLSAYQDSGGKWTVGYGHTGPEVQSGYTVTLPEATTLLQSDIGRLWEGARNNITYPLEQNHVDALGDWAFNMGPGRFRGSQLLEAINRGDWEYAALQLGKWVYQGKVKLPGLVCRRKTEAGVLLGQGVKLWGWVEGQGLVLLPPSQ